MSLCGVRLGLAAAAVQTAARGGGGETEPTPVDTVVSEVQGVLETVEETAPALP
jgi:hypothetical protein